MPKKRTAAMVEGPPSKKPTRSPVKPAPQEKGSSNTCNTQIYLLTQSCRIKCKV